MLCWDACWPNHPRNPPPLLHWPTRPGGRVRYAYGPHVARVAARIRLPGPLAQPGTVCRIFGRPAAQQRSRNSGKAVKRGRYRHSGGAFRIVWVVLRRYAGNLNCVTSSNTPYVWESAPTFPLRPVSGVEIDRYTNPVYLSPIFAAKIFCKWLFLQKKKTDIQPRRDRYTDESFKINKLGSKKDRYTGYTLLRVPPIEKKSPRLHAKAGACCG